MSINMSTNEALEDLDFIELSDDALEAVSGGKERLRVKTGKAGICPRPGRNYRHQGWHGGPDDRKGLLCRAV